MSNNPTQTTEWQNLIHHHTVIKDTRTETLFEQDDERFNKLSFSLDGLLFDISKNKVTQETINLLCALANAQNLPHQKQALFNGDTVNTTENRPALHTHQRDGSQKLNKSEHISEQIRQKKWAGYTGKPIKNIVHIGLGGSGLGPELVHETFLEQKIKSINFHFITNIDGTSLTRALSECDPETTLFIVVSKSFTTQETCMNSDTAKKWLINHYQDKGCINRHFIAITANPEKAVEYGINQDNILSFDQGVGGRFSLWSAIGLTTAIAFGHELFSELLNGAHAMDTHFKNEPLERNIPVLLALVDIWHRNFFHYQAKAVLPYAQALHKLPAYLQQLEMESNGKNIDLNGNFITYKTAPVIFGGVGTTSQHSVFQLFHQGTDVVPGDFIGIKKCINNLPKHHSTLLNNFLAQPQALMQGRESDIPHKQFLGDRPSSSIILKKMDPYHLGMLIALYEHKIFVQSVIWNINAFDQFGVELGKELANNMENNDIEAADPSTKALYSFITQEE